MFGLFSTSRPSYLGTTQTAASSSAVSGVLGFVSKLLGSVSDPPYVGQAQRNAPTGFSLFGKSPAYVQRSAQAPETVSGSPPETATKELPLMAEVVMEGDVVPRAQPTITILIKTEVGT